MLTKDEIAVGDRLEIHFGCRASMETIVIPCTVVRCGHEKYAMVNTDHQKNIFVLLTDLQRSN